MAKMICPKCKSEMKENDHGAFVCTNTKCKGVFLPKSIFGVTE